MWTAHGGLVTTDTSFLLSQLFADSYPNTARARKRWESFYGPRYHGAMSKSEKASSRALFELPRRDGFSPVLHYCDKDHEAAVALTTRLLRRALKNTAEYFRDEQPCGVLVLVPFQASAGRAFPDWSGIAREACRRVDVRFIDYSNDEDDIRRQTYSGDEVRISTFHSAKGIEGLHVLVLGFDELANTAPADVERGTNNLGHIVLSRSQYDTDVVCLDRSDMKRKEIEFLEMLIQVVGN